MANSNNSSDNKSVGKADTVFIQGGIPERCHLGVKTITRYWESIHPAHGLPGRQHFDPVAIPNLLANIRLVDVVGRPPRFRVRLTGSRLSEFFGASDTDRWMDEIYPQFKKTATFENYLRVCKTRRPNWRVGRCELGGANECVQYERVQLPFANDGETVDMILIYGVFGRIGELSR